MAYLLRPATDSKAPPGLIFSTGPDDISCQAEILVLYRKAIEKPDCPKGQIVCTWKIEKDLSADKWLSLFADDNRGRIGAAKGDILVSSWSAFHKGIVPMPKVVGGFVLGREVPDEFQLVTKDPVDTTKTGADILKEALTNPLHAGIHPEFKATVPEEMWIKAAVLGLKSMGADKWISEMVDTLRSYFGGSARIPVPHKNDSCFCKSGKKYGKCCGEGVQEEDPEDCKLGKHDFQDDWEKAASGKFIRGCQACLKIEEAPYGEDVTLSDGTQAVLIGCKICQTAPTVEDAEGLTRDWKAMFGCSFCGQPIELKEVLVAHYAKKDGTHGAQWKLSRLKTGSEFSSLRSRESSTYTTTYIVHEACLKQALPHSGQYSKVLTDEDDQMMFRKGGED